VDIGADETILPRALAELVGIAIEPGSSAIMVSASGEITVSYGHVTFELGQVRSHYRCPVPEKLIGKQQ
jgi:hypothetical protein